MIKNLVILSCIFLGHFSSADQGWKREAIKQAPMVQATILGLQAQQGYGLSCIFENPKGSQYDAVEFTFNDTDTDFTVYLNCSYLKVVIQGVTGAGGSGRARVRNISITPDDGGL